MKKSFLSLLLGATLFAGTPLMAMWEGDSTTTPTTIIADAETPEEKQQRMKSIVQLTKLVKQHAHDTTPEAEAARESLKKSFEALTQHEQLAILLAITAFKSSDSSSSSDEG